MTTSVATQASPLPNRPQQEARESILKEIAASRQKARTRKPSRTLVSDLKIGRPVGCAELLVLRRYPRRTVSSKAWTGSLAAACARDESGLVGLVLWGDQVDRVRTGDIIRIENGWCRMSQGQKVVSTGRTGRLTVLAA